MAYDAMMSTETTTSFVACTGREFTVLESFWCEEVRSEYVVGLHYTAISPALDRLLDKWIGEGKAELFSGAIARISGE